MLTKANLNMFEKVILMQKYENDKKMERKMRNKQRVHNIYNGMVEKAI